MKMIKSQTMGTGINFTSEKNYRPVQNTYIAVTEFKVIKRDAGRCYLECHPITGKIISVSAPCNGLYYLKL